MLHGMDWWTFGGVDASIASTWFGLRHARLKVVVLQRTVVSSLRAPFSSFGCFVFEIWVLRFRDLGASFSSFGCFVFEFWVLRFRDLGASFSSLGCFVFEIWVLRFRDLGASFSSFGCFVFEIWVLRASVFVFECFVFETTDKRQIERESSKECSVSFLWTNESFSR